MAKYILIASIVVMILTGGLGFVTKSKVDELQSSKESAVQETTMARADADKAKGELKKKDVQIAEVNKNLEEAKAATSAAQAEIASAKAEADKAKADIAAKDQQVATLTAQLAAAGDKPMPVQQGEDPQVAILRAENADLKKQVTEAQQVADTLKARDRESAEKLANAEREVQRYKAPIARAGINGRVVAVNPGWNFVVINVGDNKGASVNAPLVVTRGGQMIARLRITSVEPATSIADVVPGSMVRGQTVQPGDTVVFAGRVQAPVQEPASGGSAPNPPAPQTGGQTVQ